jgi:hypothetical protein
MLIVDSFLKLGVGWQFFLGGSGGRFCQKHKSLEMQIQF